MKEYFNFKSLTKSRKISFITYILCSLAYCYVGIKTGSLSFIFFAFFVFFTALDMFNKQCSDDIIESYSNMFDVQEYAHRTTLKIISSAIKNNDTNKLNEISNIIDTYLGKEKEDDSE